MLSPLTHQLLDLAIMEDLATGDLTTDNLPQLATKKLNGTLVARDSGVLSGFQLAQAVCQKIDPALKISPKKRDGESFSAGDTLATIEGAATSVLKAERLVLNLLQHCSGVATHTQKFVDAIAGTGCKVAHTRKTLPGLRQCQLAAVQHGGGAAHRASLGHAVMLKDNHVAAVGGDIASAVAQIRENLSHTATITVEVDTLAQLETVLATDANIVLLDNFSIADLKTAVALNHKIVSPKVLEASGGITLATIRTVAETGVNIISTSQLTMAAPPLDIGLDS